MSLVDGLKVGVIVGGPSPEAEGSRLSGQTAAAALEEMGARAKIIELDSVAALVAQLSEHEAAFTATHGWYGEDGKLQGLLELLRIPYTGSGVRASAIGMHKPTFKSVVSAIGINTARSHVLRGGEVMASLPGVAESLGYPFFLKPAAGGESLGSGVVRSSGDVAAIIAAEPIFESQEYLAEEYIGGTEFSVGLLERDGKLEVLPPLQITSFRDFYDVTAKTDPSTRSYECPAQVPAAMLRQLTEGSIHVFKACGCAGFARVDWLTRDEGVFALELNTIPGLTHQGNFAAMATAAGIGYAELIRAMLDSAFRKQEYRT